MLFYTETKTFVIFLGNLVKRKKILRVKVLISNLSFSKPSGGAKVSVVLEIR